MPLDTHGFEIPESNLQGLHEASRTIERGREREFDLQKLQQAKKATSASFLTNYLDPKAHLTGTNYDPQIVKGFDTLLQDGMKLISQGADTNQVMMALSPKVAQLNEYSTKAKLINQRLKDQLAQIPKNAGYDIPKLEQEARTRAFMGQDGKLKDISTIDPTADYVTETIKETPDKVTTDYGIDEYVKNSPKFTNTQTIKRTNSKGGYEMRKSKVTSPSWMVVDENGELVPKFNVALEGGKPHTFNFQTGEGRTKEAAIRLLDEKEFDSIMKGNPGVADYVRGQVKAANPSIDLNSPQAKNAARAILYDELKRRKPGGMEDVEEVKANPAPRIHISTGRQPTQKEIEAGTPLNLKQYGVEGDSYDVTPLASGIKVTGLPTGQSLAVKKLLFNPDTKEVTYTDQLGNTKKSDFETFRQDIATLNTGVDLSFIDRLKVTGRPTKNEPAKTSSKMVIMVLPDGKKGQIPEDKIAEFMKDNPKAKRQ